MDLYYAPLYIPRELYRVVYEIRMDRYKEEKKRKEEQEAQEKEERRRAEIEKRDKRLRTKILDRRLSPAVQALETKHSSQIDVKDDENQNKKASTASLAGINMEDMIDMLEEGG